MGRKSSKIFNDGILIKHDLKKRGLLILKQGEKNLQVLASIGGKETDDIDLQGIEFTYIKFHRNEAYNASRTGIMNANEGDKRINKLLNEFLHLFIQELIDGKIRVEGTPTDEEIRTVFPNELATPIWRVYLEGKKGAEGDRLRG